MSDLTAKTVAFVTSQKDIEEAELTGPWKALRDAGARTVLIAPEAGEVATVISDDHRRPQLSTAAGRGPGQGRARRGAPPRRGSRRRPDPRSVVPGR
ncbi:hypothetical protein [Georgenia sp. SYP-B2076]|uniref:hypothetical protein n=1 Tax=Georgenia sp. SYP-B2076 TaxID=2495881 RepID=UPI000F8CC479|nr:hypothetical protein [Georgenia sp. SYP-B2076]